MEIDLELYRQEVLVTSASNVRLSVIDVHPEGARHTLVCLHGFGGRARQWQYQVVRFGSWCRVVAPDLRGHGRSDKPRRAYSMAQMLSDLQSTILALEVRRPFVLVGHSFGGAIAAEFAAAHPNLVSHLILIAAATEYHLNPTYQMLLRLPLPVLQSLAPLARSKLGAPPHVLRSLYRNTLEHWSGDRTFHSLQVPTLVIRGHLDRVFEKKYFEDVAQAIPTSEEVDVGASGHMVMIERREAVNRAIARFIEPERARPGDEGELDPQRAQLVRQRPWLPHYDDKVPFTIAAPRSPLFSVLRSATRRYPARAALIFENNQLSYRQLYQHSARFANALLDLGLAKGDRVILLLPNVPQLVISFWGTLMAGGVVVFPLPDAKPDELVQQIQHAGASILIAMTEQDDVVYGIQQHLSILQYNPLRHVIFTHLRDFLSLQGRLALWLSPRQRKQHLLDIPLDSGTHLFHELLAKHSKEPPDVRLQAADLALIHYVGGSGETSKGVMLSHRNLLVNALQVRHWMGDAKEGEERFLSAAPFSHSYGLMMGLLTPTSLAATMILQAGFDVTQVLEAIQNYRPTIFPGVPHMFAALKDHRGIRQYGLDSISTCISGTAPLPVEVQEAFERVTRGRLIESYGLTEAAYVTHANPIQGQKRTGSIGIPLPSTEAQIVDLLYGRKVMPVGQVGELAVRGPQVMLGYWQDPRLTRQAIHRSGWMLTGDVAQMDSEGFFRIIASKTDMWYPDQADHPLSPRDVEEVLYEVPQVKEVAVIPFAGQPVAFVIAQNPREKPSADSLIAYCKRRLPPELTPRLVIFVDDLPRSFIGKVLRRELAKRFEALPAKDTAP